MAKVLQVRNTQLRRHDSLSSYAFSQYELSSIPRLSLLPNTAVCPTA